MDAQRAAAWLRHHAPAGVRVEEEDGDVRAFVRRDLLHLDADALHDRLQHWTLTDLTRDLPAASATVSFRHARPAQPEEAATLDEQEGWLDLEPTLTLDAALVEDGDLPRFAALLPVFVELVEGEGRPEGFRSPDVGTME